ncbi:hypothetical protein MMA231_02854 [Asticcacaulis sp. MM231]|uniref:serine aminopeptidase domain-containing protein n=1 Tax=Asticcacaulis sp. MM231 TaxID=3157666 RepID=UPI0032D58B4C
MALDRRALLTAFASTALAPSLTRAQVTANDFDLPLADGRVVRVISRNVPNPRGVVLFSHGGGSWPEQYDKMGAFLLKQGFAVLAPLHTDSVKIPEDKRATLQSSFPQRIADMAAVAAYAKSAYKDLPQIAAGHSYGSLFALMLGGGLDYVAPLYTPDVKAVVCFSSPGAIPSLINPTSYSTLKAPLLMVTGDADTVPGFVTDWHDHLLPFEGTTVKESYALIIKGGGHELISGADPVRFALASDVTRQFLGHEILGSDVTISLPAGAAAELRQK